MVLTQLFYFFGFVIHFFYLYRLPIPYLLYLLSMKKLDFCLA